MESSNEKEKVKLKIVLVGDGGVGKSTLINYYTTGKFEETVPSVVDEYKSEVRYKKRTIQLEIYDSMGEEEYSNLIQNIFPETDLFFVCFSVDDPTSYENVKTRWAYDLGDYNVRDGECPWRKIPRFCVACKTDLRKDTDVIERLNEKDEHPINKDEGYCVFKVLHFHGYFECSSKEGKGIQKLFNAAFDLKLGNEFKVDKPPNCSVL